MSDEDRRNCIDHQNVLLCNTRTWLMLAKKPFIECWKDILYKLCVGEIQQRNSTFIAPKAVVKLWMAV